MSKKLTEAIEDCLSLIDDAVELSRDIQVENQEPLPSLLEQCELISSEAALHKEPIRTLHHFACTGGTLFAKCIASMPNTQVLSEVEPHSQLISIDERRFTPTDLIHLVRASSRGSDSGLETKIFLSGLGAIFENCQANGLRLVLRDHAHSKYCFGDTVTSSKSLYEVVNSQFSTLSVVTVRHPLDSFLSLNRNGWQHFKPFTLEEYSNRYLGFLKDHNNMQVFKYEDLVSDPQKVVTDICNVLQIPFTEDFDKLFGAQRLSGDSGRSATNIGKRSRLAIPDFIKDQLSEPNESYSRLCAYLHYGE